MANMGKTNLTGNYYDLQNPEFEDYTITAEPTDIEAEKEKIVSKNSLFSILEGIKGTLLILHTLYKNVRDGKINTADIVDNLTSTSTTLPLSANQGKILNTSITQLSSEKLNKTVVCSNNNITFPSESGHSFTLKWEDGYLYIVVDVTPVLKIRGGTIIDPTK